MSIKIMSKVWPLQMGHADKLVLLALADNASDEGECWPSVSTLCEKTCLSDRAVQQCVRRLIEAGHISVTRRYKQSNVFRVHPNAVCPERPSPEARSPEAPSPERPSPEAPSPEGNDISTPNDVHPEPSYRTVKKSTRAKNATRKTPIPEDFDLTEARRSYAEKHLPDVDAVALMDLFRSTSKAKGWRYVDWDQHWQTLVRQWAPNSGHWSSGQYPRKRGGVYANAI